MRDIFDDDLTIKRFKNIFHCFPGQQQEYDVPGKHDRKKAICLANFAGTQGLK